MSLKNGRKFSGRAHERDGNDSRWRIQKAGQRKSDAEEERKNQCRNTWPCTS